MERYSMERFGLADLNSAELPPEDEVALSEALRQVAQVAQEHLTTPQPPMRHKKQSQRRVVRLNKPPTSRP